MKRLLFFSVLSIFCLKISAQTNTWTGSGANNNWNTTLNWSLNSVPTAAQDVVIPTGFTVDLNVSGSTKSITLQGNSTFNISNSLSFTNPSSFGSNTTINFSNGDIKGGGTMTNNGIINFITGNSKYIFGNTVLDNLGKIKFTGTGIVYINDGTINNQTLGIMDLQTAGGNISYTAGATHKINNSGLIKRTSNTGDVNIIAELHNNGGTIAVETGSLTFNFGLIKLTGGVYNVSNNASLNWINSVTCEGTLTGVLNGKIDWSGVVAVPAAATFNFSGNTGVNWTNGSLNGGGVLTNKSKITMLTANSRYVLGNTTVKNEGVINFESTGVFYVNDGTINNETGGLIDLKSDGNNMSYTAGSTHVLNNSGTIKRSLTNGTSSIGIVLNNNAGTISVDSGILDFGGLMKNLTNGTYNVASNSSLLWNSQIVCAQTLVGTLNGQISWNGEVNIPQGTTSIFNFTGSTGVIWTNGNLRGGGTLNNKSEITLLTANSKYIFDNTILENNGDINYDSTGIWYVNDGTINNKTSGIIDLKANGSTISYTAGNAHKLNNNGLIKSTVPTGTSTIIIELHNNDGTISVESGSLNFVTLPKYLNDGIYDVATGTSLTFNTQIVLSGTLTGALDGEILWNSEVNVPTGTSANFDFTGSTGVNWSNGSLSGEGTLVNKSMISMVTSNSKYIFNNTKLNNEGIINYESDGLLYINDGTINNQPTGLIDFQADGTTMSYTAGATHVLNNFGLLKRSTTTGVSTFIAVLNNNDGTVEVESGSLNFSGLTKYLTDGNYNVSSGNNLQWNTQIVCEGTLEGVLDGEIAWNNEVNVQPTKTATFNFTGNIGVNWKDGNLRGGGTLVNAGELTFLSGASKYIFDNSLLNNDGTINYESVGILYVNDGIINNEAAGVIDLITDGNILSYTAGSSHVFNNMGLLKKSAGVGTTSILANTTNSGIVNVMIGELEFINGLNFINTTDGKVMGIATIDVPAAANFINNGTFAPGESAGILTVLGDFKSTSSSELEIELNGSNQGTDYDLLAVQGNAIFDGSINLLMGFAANVGDEFIVATTTGTITQCSLQPTASGYFDGFIYNFDVICRNGNQVVLTVNSIVLGIEENTLSSIKMYPNPSNGNFTIDLGREYTDVTVQIYNMLGQQISFVNFASTKLIRQEINTSAGIYFVKVSTAKEGSKTLRIIKR
ncbi:beta strand repeat-containing protein [Aequorivita capsosiphonis]|uniref:beta strand repeat-containing protein n=1 Tax=Aequorivita capsosiphonis TaxID=487317 RepID=UPI00146FABC4|nr:T9SS type A sorting domain-containing protein [Aequorivita capsosiphonis]